MMQVSKSSVIVRTVLAILFALIWVFPVVWLVLSSFKPGSELFTFPLTLFPKDLPVPKAVPSRGERTTPC